MSLQPKNATEADLIKSVLKKRVYQNVYEQFGKTNRSTGAISTVPNKDERSGLL